MLIRRLPGNPIIAPGMPVMKPEIAQNINGPSLIRVPYWLPHPLGRYYLYFAHHGGDHIRLAYADTLEGPWRIHAPGTLHLTESHFINHIASPDVHVDHDRRQIRMYFHGVLRPEERGGILPEIDDAFFTTQRTRVATSPDGLRFTVAPPIIASAISP